ncbi:MAG: phosphate acyltransferase [Verrucomicrobiota bacterium]
MSAPADSIHDPANDFLRPMIETLRRHPKRIVFPSGLDERVIRVAAELVRTQAIAPILLGSRTEIRALAAQIGVSLEFVGIIDPVESSDFSFFCERYRRVEKARRRKVEDPAAVMAKPAYFAAMMVQYGYADGIVGGNEGFPAAFFRSLLHLIRPQPGFTTASSCLPIRLASRPDLGFKGTLFLSDCALVPSPSTSQLATSAVLSARAAHLLCGEKPRVAMISFSTRGSARDASTLKVLAAMELAREQAKRLMVDMDIDGELQLDAAMDPESMQRKAPGSVLGGRANVLVFPDLNTAHVAFKMLEIAAGAEPYGQLVLGLARPACQVSRVARERTIFGAALCTGMRSMAFRDLVNAEDFR